METDSTSFNVRDKFLAASSCLVLLISYMILAILGLDTKFLEGAFLVMIGVLGGLLKSSPSPTTTTQIEKSAVTNVDSKG